MHRPACASTLALALLIPLRKPMHIPAMMHASIHTCMVGNATPSPRPMMARTSSSSGSQRRAADRGVSIVNSDHTTTPTLSTVFGDIEAVVGSGALVVDTSSVL